MDLVVLVILSNIEYRKIGFSKEFEHKVFQIFGLGINYYSGVILI